MTVLILGGTGEARQLAAALVAAETPVISSLAGRVTQPRLPPGAARVGGFGGSDELTHWIVGRRITAVIDATHPFATRISAAAAEACLRAGVPLIRLERPGWLARPGDRWHRVRDITEAAAVLPDIGRRVLLTLGRQHVAAFAYIRDAWFLIRSIDPPAPPLPPRHELLTDRGPFTLDGELSLIDRRSLDLVVTRDSGGELTAAKLDAARERDMPVLMIDRPPGSAVMTVHTVADAAAWVGADVPQSMAG